MAESSGLLKVLFPRSVHTENLFLDPNNPRLFGIPSYRSTNVPEERIIEDAVQRDVYETMIRENSFDVKALYDSIVEVGFLPIDQIIVKRIRGTDNYVVLEGNRRLAAMKWVIFDHNRSEITLSQEKINSMSEINVVEYRGPREREKIDRIILQGTRHISGVKDWGPYEKALGIVELLNTGRTASEVGSILSMSAIEVNRFKRGHYALEQWSENDEYGEYAKPNMFTIIQEVTTRPFLRDEWLSWNEREGRFENERNLKLLYGWICPNDDLGGKRKISDVRYIRTLHEVIQDEEAYQELLDNESEYLDAYSIVRQKKIIIRRDYQQELSIFLRDLRKIPVEVLEKRELLTILQEIQTLLSTRIDQARRLLNGSP